MGIEILLTEPPDEGLKMNDGFSRINSFNSAKTTAHGKSTGRLVNKDGSYCIEHLDHPNIFWIHWRNFFQILLEIKWRWVWLVLCIMFPLSWMVFAILFYAVARVHGDLEDNVNNNGTRTEIIPCVANAKTFLALFLYSVETQETIGYGYRYDTEECPLLLFFLCLQVVIGAILQACLCAVIWARMLRPKRRGQEVIFSKNACIYLNDEKEMCLVFRLSDIDGTHLVQSCVRLYVAVKTRVPNSNSFSFILHHMPMGEDYGRDKVLFIWPTLAYHVINQKSILYKYDRQDFEKSDLEFILVAEGIVESTGLTVQTRTSYLVKEVLWGHKFQRMNFGEKGTHSKVKVKYNDFDKTYAALGTPDHSASELDERKSSMQRINTCATVLNFPHLTAQNA